MKRNGKGKEYDFDGYLIYEGEYSNNQKNGKGKEYYQNGNLMFEGEYKNNLRWNGILYEPNNNNIYQLKNGKGFIKEFNYDGNIIFEGEYLNGKRNGKGKE